MPGREMCGLTTTHARAVDPAAFHFETIGRAAAAEAGQAMADNSR
jgi:hypothetical protein